MTYRAFDAYASQSSMLSPLEPFQPWMYNWLRNWSILAGDVDLLCSSAYMQKLRPTFWPSNCLKDVIQLHFPGQISWRSAPLILYSVMGKEHRQGALSSFFPSLHFYMKRNKRVIIITTVVIFTRCSRAWRKGQQRFWKWAIRNYTGLAISQSNISRSLGNQVTNMCIPNRQYNTGGRRAMYVIRASTHHTTPQNIYKPIYQHLSSMLSLLGLIIFCVV